MARIRHELNTIYISGRLQESLRPVSRCALTAVVAPMGYGKTTAVNWFLAREAPPHCIRISVYSAHLAILWRSAQEAFAHAGFPFLRDYDCPVDAAGAGLLADGLCRGLAGPEPCYLFLDDFHLLADARVADFLCTLANRLPENVHLIVAGRDRFLPADAQLRLGIRLHRIGAEQLRLGREELAVYARRCGAALSESQLTALLTSTEGWFSAVYLNLRSLAERGTLAGGNSDIYAMFTAAMLDPLPQRTREFLAVLGLADEFTAEMARFVTEETETEQLLGALTAQNAFASLLPDGVTYRFHHMMKACAAQVFRTLPEPRQRACRARYGRWYAAHGQMLHAMDSFRRCGDYASLLDAVTQDAGILLSTLDPALVLSALEECPKDAVLAHPLAILVLMRCMFNWSRIPKMLELRELLQSALDTHPELPPNERGNLLGECDLILSFLSYNDISAMSRLHRSASSKMTRPAITIRRSGGWTFGSPSVLMMFHRTPGALEAELSEMDECMPHYYRVTNGHGRGAEQIMRAEALLLQCRFADAHIALERARSTGPLQESMALCCDLLALRLSLFRDVSLPYTREQRNAGLVRQHNAAWLPIFYAICAYYDALRGDTERIPELFRLHRLDTVHILAPGRPMYDMIENQVWLAQGEYARLIGRSEALLAACARFPYALVALHVRIQTAAAYAQLGKRAEAEALLEQALADAAPDGLILPFAENYRYLAPLLENRPDTQAIAELGRLSEARRTRPAALAGLTPRELELADLLAQRLTNREIAGRLGLSEGSVKQYLNQLYAKLHIDGDTRRKRQELAVLLKQSG